MVMQKFPLLTTLCVSTLMSAGAVAPVSAGPISTDFSVTPAQSDVIQVRDGVRWYRGYRGYRNYRPGYRHYDGWWYPGGAFVAGALIGGAIANSNNYYRPYYGDGYYDYDGYAPRYYVRRQYEVAPGSAYRQGYRDGYRAGRSDRYYGGYPCSQRLEDAGKC